MKRVALTTAIAAAMLAGSVQAATIYEGNGLKYDLKGDLQVQLRQKIGDNQDQDLEFDDLELKNRVTYSLNEGMSAFAQLDYSFDKRANDQSADSQDGGKLEEAYLGLKFDNIALRLGKQNYSTDEFSVEKAYETVVEDDIFDLNDDAGDDVVRVDAQFENLFVSVSTDLKAEGNGDSDGTKSTDLFVSTAVGDLGLMAAYQNYQELGSDSVSSWGVGVTFDAGFAKFGADYGSMEDTADVYNLVASFPVADTTTVAVGIQNRDEDAGDDVTGWYANATYKFPEQKAVSVFGEIGDTDADNTDPGYLVGMRIVF
ncbi:porin [uncultured Amphritea sp.]|uniref:porin n=1 Tax=uncultured Amphritea sp. TaxID=981605 RepID=UPI0025CCB635|nr:porin [uncultured Amphritea sp.]